MVDNLPDSSLKLPNKVVSLQATCSDPWTQSPRGSNPSWRKLFSLEIIPSINSALQGLDRFLFVTGSVGNTDTISTLQSITKEMKTSLKTFPDPSWRCFSNEEMRGTDSGMFAG